MHKDQKMKTIGNTLKILQKVIVFALFFGIIGIVIYSLIFMTPFYDMYLLDMPFLFKKMDIFGITQYYKDAYAGITDAFSYNTITGNANGMNLAYFTAFARQNGVQIYNHWLFEVGFIGIVVSLLFFIFGNQKRNRYYLSNYLATGAVCGFDLYVAFSILIQGPAWQAYVASTDFKILNAYQSYMNDQTEIVEYYSMAKCNWVFTLGTVLAIILIALCASAIVLAVCKFLYQRKLPKIDFSEVKIDE